MKMSSRPLYPRALLFFLCFLTPLESRAAIIYVKASAMGSKDGSSWANAYTLLQDALEASKSGDEIWVAAGTYQPTKGTDRTDPFWMKNGVDVYGGFAGNETRRDQRDWVAHETILKAQSNSWYIVWGMAEPSQGGVPGFVLDGFTITGCKNNSIYSGSGAGMSCSYISPTISHCVFTGNEALNGGAGMDINGGSPIITQCTFSGNTVTGPGGSGGGGIYNRSSAIITSCTFIGNKAPRGAGILEGGKETVITGCTFQNNTVTSSYMANSGGGGISIICASQKVSRCVFTGNSATSGGGIYFSPRLNYTTTVSQCIFSGNTAGDGGGVYISWTSPIITRCVFSDNTATRRGGGLMTEMGYPNIIGCTFSRNTAAIGGGLHCDSAPTLINSIFWGNQAATGSEIYNRSGTPTVYYCDIRSTPWDSSFLGFSLGIVQTDPLFCDPVHPAGLDGRWMTPDDGLRLPWNSPCIDAGLSSGVPDLDILGRPRNGLVDIGAYEYGSPANGVKGWVKYR